jgi:hypothetical protein
LIDPRIEKLVSRLREAFPCYVVAVRPYCSPDDPLIEYFIDILQVPDDDLCPASEKAWNLAFELLGDAPVFFLMTTVGRENSAKFFAKELVEFGAGTPSTGRPPVE